MSTGDRLIKTTSTSQTDNPGGYIPPDSALARTAADLLDRHLGEPGQMCAFCGEPSPCPSARHALEVSRAVGVNRGSFRDGFDQNASAANQPARWFGMEQRGGTPHEHLNPGASPPADQKRPSPDVAEQILDAPPNAAPDSSLRH